MKHEEIYMKLFGFSRPTYYKRKREKVAAITIFEKYFTDEDLEEFLETGEIGFLESCRNKSSKIFKEIADLKDRVERLEEGKNDF